MAFETTQSEAVFHGKVFDVRKDRVRMPDGKLVDLDIVEHNRSVSMVPLDERGRIWFVRQYRHPAGRELLELPAGVIEEDEPPIESAQREIREEIGMAAGSLEEIGRFYLAPGYSTEYMYVYLATKLSAAPLEQDEDEFITLEKIPLEEAMQMAAEGEFEDAKTLAALLLTRRYLQKRPSG